MLLRFARFRGALAATLLLVACSGGQARNQDPPGRLPPTRALALNAGALSGEKIIVVPITVVVADSAVAADSFFRSRARVLAWADSMIGEALTVRGREVTWVLPAELRLVARRAPSMNVDPDRMGQAVMGSPRADALPDPLRAHIRNLVALAGGRYAFIPPAVAFVSLPDGTVRAELSAVLADSRNGKVNWRSLVMGVGATPAAALQEALILMLPDQMGP